jgi:prepilin-type N-terminal cleavage/methylation domain-containing protein
MKTHRLSFTWRPQSRAFTLIELLVVITIISILAALTMGTFTYAQQSSARNRTTAGLSAIINALEQYKEKFGEYPEAASPDLRGSGSASSLRIGGALMLYQAITGDGFEHIKGAEKSNPQGSPASDGIVDASERANSIRGDLPKTMILNTASGYMLIDGFGRPYQYDKGGTPEAVNATFDAWSFAQKEADDVSLTAKKDANKTAVWIKNW